MNAMIRQRLLATALLLVCLPALAVDRPLLIDGKTSLFQRVLSIPGAALRDTPGGSGGEASTPFTAYYVYAREQAAGAAWLLVGTDRHGGTDGWLPADDTLVWNQGLTVRFRPAVDPDRALLFGDAASARALADSPDDGRYDRFYAAASEGRSLAGSPVVAIQPPGELDLRDDFYLVPILDFQELYLGNERARLLEVSSVPLENAAPVRPEPVSTVADAGADAPTDDSITAADDAYRAGIAFVIDSTLSMDPYIERTRAAVRKIHGSLVEAGLVGNVNFGLVAFRDSTQAVPGLEYLARTFVDLEQGRDPARFLARVDGLSASTVSSQDFIEDAYAGVRQALDDMDWQGHAARYLVLITDAGPREVGDPLSGTGLSAEQLSALAQERGVAIFVLHLLTDATQSDHDYAAERYRRLAQFPGIGDLYYAVPTGDVREFGQVLDTLAGQITMQVRMAAVSQAQQAVAATPPPPAPVTDNPQLTELQDKVRRLGYALQMQYFAKRDGVRPPRVFNAWLFDRDIRDPSRRMLDVQVLLTRDQLSDLHDVLRNVLRTAEDGLLSPEGFLNELQSLAATVTRDPDRIGATTATTAGAGNSLADLGFMREYIEDLPYTGEVMNLSLADWETWPARRQIEFLHGLEGKISFYRALHDNTDLWVSLDGGPVDGDAVFPIGLEMLP
jgi:serine/threonine-protein kinase PpkA